MPWQVVVSAREKERGGVDRSREVSSQQKKISKLGREREEFRSSKKNKKTLETEKDRSAKCIIVMPSQLQGCDPPQDPALQRQKCHDTSLSDFGRD